MPPGLVPTAGVALSVALNTSPSALPAMAARQAVLGKYQTGGKRRRVHHTLAESAKAAAAAAAAAPMPAGWTPSRFFGAWRKEVDETAGFEVYWSSMGHYRALTPKVKKKIIKTILRITIASEAYDSDDFYEGVLASHNDYEAMQAYTAAFVDAFWKCFWTDSDVS